MKRAICLFAALLTWMSAVQAQEVAWRGTVEHLKGDMYRVVIEADIPDGCHIYDMGPYDGGPAATSFVCRSGKGAVPVGRTEQLTVPERRYDETYAMTVGTFAGRPRFAQKVRLLTETATVTVGIGWMVCDGESCMPPGATELTVPLKRTK